MHMAMSSQNSTAELFSLGSDFSPIASTENDISQPTDELVIGVVGAVGSGASTTVKRIEHILRKDYEYNVHVIRARDIIRENAKKIPFDLLKNKSEAKEIRQLQNVGAGLRDKFGNEYIAAKIIEKIAALRDKISSDDGDTLISHPKYWRHATIIDSLKHPEETDLLRRVYGDIYWQFTVFAHESIRGGRLECQGIRKSELGDIFARDEDDKEGAHGQKVSKTAYRSDFFIRNNAEIGEGSERTKKYDAGIEKLDIVIQRYLGILFNISVHTPTADETGMYTAVSAARNSACLSRQVGASLYSKDGELISVGWNDVPKFSGGLYSTGGQEKDNRCFLWGGKICHNDQKKDELYKKVLEKLKEAKLLKKGVDEEKVRSVLMETPISNLIEYSRSIHAEMEAIVSAGRTGKSGMVGGTLYTTTFPCHNCARHIVAAGISKVYYIEPYAKSLAFNLHGDAIEIAGESEKKVTFLQYEGVGPKNALRLFYHGAERKRYGTMITFDKKSAHPVLCPPMYGFTTREKRVMMHLEKVEENILQLQKHEDKYE